MAHNICIRIAEREFIARIREIFHENRQDHNKLHNTLSMWIARSSVQASESHASYHIYRLTTWSFSLLIQKTTMPSRPYKRICRLSLTADMKRPMPKYLFPSEVHLWTLVLHLVLFPNVTDNWFEHGRLQGVYSARSVYHPLLQVTGVFPRANAISKISSM